MSRIVRIIIFIIFAWAAVTKLLGASGGPTIYSSWITSHPPLRFLVPAIEIGLAFWILSGWRPSASSIIAIVMLSAFSGLLMLELKKEHPKPCGCMGARAALYEPSAIRHDLVLSLGRNIVMMGGLVYLLGVQGSQIRNGSDENTVTAIVPTA